MHIYTIMHSLVKYMGFPDASAGKKSTCNVGDLGSIPGLGRSPGEGNSNPLQLPGEFHGQRSLAGHSPWGHKELDTTEQLSLHFSFTNFTVQSSTTRKTIKKNCLPS